MYGYSRKLHERELGKRINQLRAEEPIRKLTAEHLAEKLGIEVGSKGYQNVLDILRQEEQVRA
jgi:hypothetical protein